MKKLLAIVLVAALGLTLCACGRVFTELKDRVENAVENVVGSVVEKVKAAPKEAETETGSAQKAGRPVGTVRIENPDRRPTPARAGNADETAGTNREKRTENTAADRMPPARNGEPSAASGKKTAETVTPVISAAKYAFTPVRVTKSPTSETVYEGGSASFVAYAENCTGISWLIVNPNGKDFVDAAALAKAMPGLAISGVGTNTLTLGCIPASFDGWYIQAKFYGEGGSVHSSMARLTVWPYPAGCTAGVPWNWSGSCEPWGGTCTPWTPGSGCAPWGYGYYDPWSCGY